MAKNGSSWLRSNLWAIIIVAAAAVAAYAVLTNDVKEMKPEVKLNSRHRIEDEATDVQILKKQDEILVELRK